MPLKTWNTKADFDAAYDISAEPDGHPITRPAVRLHYNRAVMYPVAATHAQRIVSILALQPTMKIGILGCGFGWILEELETMGFTQVIGTDTSTWIQTNKLSTEDAEINQAIIEAGLDPLTGRGAELHARLTSVNSRSLVPTKVLNEDAASNASRNRIRNALGGGNFTWGITDSVLESLTDAEAQTLSSRGHQIANNVAHLVVTTRPGNHIGYNWKTLEQWKALIPADTFIQIGGSWRFL